MGMALAAGAMVGGMGLSYYATTSEGKEAAKLGKIAQQQYDAEALATEQAGQYESREKRKEGARVKATRIADILATGGTLTGSSLTKIVDEAGEYEADARMISRNYGLQASQLRFTGAMERYKGQVARRASRIRATANLLSSAGMMGMSGGGGGTGSTTTVSNMRAAPTGGDIGRATMRRY